MKNSRLFTCAALLAMAALLNLAYAAPAAADTYAVWGDGGTDVTFFVVSKGNASVTLRQSEGLCTELSYTHLIDGITGKEEEWGKYHIRIVNPSGASWTEEWDETFFGEEYTLQLPSYGTYRVTLVPYTADEMTDSWTADIFIGWEKLPVWWIESMNRCSCSDQAPQRAGQPVPTAPQAQSKPGTVTVCCCDEYGNTIRTEYRTLYQSQIIDPPAISGYQTLSSGEYVSLNASAGLCDPSYLYFYYERIGQSALIPQLPADSYTVWLRNANVERITPQCGPGYGFSVFSSMRGSTRLYKPRDITYMRARFRSGEWIYVEFGYTDGVLRYGFFERSLFNSSMDLNGLAECPLETGKYGTVTVDTTPYNGPGMNCGSYSSCVLYQGTEVFACMESNGWYLCRFYNDHQNNYGFVYLWVPGTNIRWN